MTKTYESSDLGMLAYLRLMGIEPISNETKDERRVVYHFVIDDRLMKAVDGWVKDAPCPVRSYSDAIKTTKADIMRKSRSYRTTEVYRR